MYVPVFTLLSALVLAPHSPPPLLRVVRLEGILVLAFPTAVGLLKSLSVHMYEWEEVGA